MERPKFLTHEEEAAIQAIANKVIANMEDNMNKISGMAEAVHKPELIAPLAYPGKRRDVVMMMPIDQFFRRVFGESKS